MNKNKLTAICHNISREEGISFNSALIYFFLECILKKLALSNYHEKFIFKGFFLSNLVGINSRSTVDIDLLLQDTNFSEENIIRILNEALKKKSTEDILYEIQNVVPIKEDDKYGGFRVSILCKIENIRQIIPLDIATGDIITPNPINYKYVSSFTQENILIKAYPKETMLSEKIHTIYSRGF